MTMGYVPKPMDYGSFSSRYVVPQKNNYSSIYMLYNVSCCRTIVHLHKDEKIHQANL